MGEQIAFYLLGILTLGGAVATVTRRNPLVAAVCLVGTFFALAGIYALLEAHFIAAIQVLVYAGAIMVLFVFVIMTVDRPELEEIGFLRSPGTKLLGLGAIGVIGWRLAFALVEVGDRKELPEGFGTTKAMGQLLLGDYLFPFEAVSLVLLVAIVGAVVLSRRTV